MARDEMKIALIRANTGKHKQGKVLPIKEKGIEQKIAELLDDAINEAMVCMGRLFSGAAAYQAFNRKKYITRILALIEQEQALKDEALKAARQALTHDSCWSNGPDDPKQPEVYDHSCPGCKALAKIDQALKGGQQEQQPMIPYEKVSKELNRRVMLGATQIGIIADGGEVLQSENKNVITISHKGFYYHINLTELVPIILDWEEKNG